VSIPDPIQPEPHLQVDAESAALLRELAHAGIVARVLIAAMMAAVAVLLVLTTGVVWRLNDWRGWLFMALVLEPLTLFTILGAVYCLVPHGAFGRWFALMMPRAKRVVVIVLGTFAVLIVFGLAAALWKILRG
jgi:hypothetical protein